MTIKSFMRVPVNWETCLRNEVVNSNFKWSFLNGERSFYDSFGMKSQILRLELLYKCLLKTMYTCNICCVLFYCFHHSSYDNRAFKLNLPSTFITKVIKINKEQSPFSRKGLNRFHVRVLLKNVNNLMQLFNISAVKVWLLMSNFVLLAIRLQKKPPSNFRFINKYNKYFGAPVIKFPNADKNRN